MLRHQGKLSALLRRPVHPYVLSSHYGAGAFRGRDQHKGHQEPLFDFKRILYGTALMLLSLSGEDRKDARGDNSGDQKIKFAELGPRRYAVQYAANDPIEDRIIWGELNSVEGEVLGVFDGHGGAAVGLVKSRVCSPDDNQRVGQTAEARGGQLD